MKPAINFIIIGLLLVITSLLAWPYAHDTYIRNTKAYELDAKFCDMERTTGLYKGQPFAGIECFALIKRKYGLTT